MSEIVQQLLDALAGGVIAAAKGTATQAVKDAYQTVKDHFAGRLSSLHSLEEDPHDPDVRKVVGKELARKALLMSDPVLLEKLRNLEVALEGEPPGPLVDIGHVRAAKDVLISDIEANDLARFKGIEAGGSVRIQRVRSGTRRARPKN